MNTISQKINTYNKEVFYLLGLVLVLGLLMVLFSPIAALFIILGIIIIGVSVWRVDLGIIILVVYTAIESLVLKFTPDEIYSIARFGGEGLLLIMCGALLVKMLFKQEKIKVMATPIDLLVLLFIVIGLISTIINDVEITIGFLGLRQLLRYLLIFYLVIYLKPNKIFVDLLIKVVISLIVFEALLGLIQIVGGQAMDSYLLPQQDRLVAGNILVAGVEQTWYFTQRVFATFGRYDKLGIFLCFFTLVFTGLSYETKDKNRKKIYLAVAGLSIFTMIFTYSRMSWLGFLMGLILIAGFFKKDKRVLKILASLLVIFLLYSGFYFFTTKSEISYFTESSVNNLIGRFWQSFSSDELRISYEGAGRIYFWTNTPLKVVKNYPLLGVGLGQYGGGVAAVLNNTRVYDELGMPFGVQNMYGQIDNNWLSIWGETGTIGLLLMLSIMVIIFLYSQKIYKLSKSSLTKGLALGLLGATMAYAIQNFFGPYFEVRTIALYFWLFMGIVFSFGIQEGILLKKRNSKS